MTSDQSRTSSRHTSLRIRVPITSATSIAELTSRVRCEVVNRNSIKTGKDRHNPTNGKYKRCSKITSLIGKKLDVGASAMKNHKIENETIGWRFRSHQAQL